MKKYIHWLIASLIYGSLLLVVYMIHIKFFSVGVVFYSALFDSIVAATLALLILIKFRFFSLFSRFEKILIFLIWLLIGYSLAISVPTVIDRSLSFYILEKIQQRGGGIKLDSFEDVFTKEYVVEHHLVDVRLTEQLESGTIKIENGCVKLTDKGSDIANFSRYFRQHWLPKSRLLMGSYSDVLTDPFKASITQVDYKCN